MVGVAQGPPWLEPLVSFIVLSVLLSCAIALLRYICGVLCCCRRTSRVPPPPPPPPAPARQSPTYLVRSVTYTTVVTPWEASTMQPMHGGGGGSGGGGGGWTHHPSHRVNPPLPSSAPPAWPPPAEVLPDVEAEAAVAVAAPQQYRGYAFSTDGTNPHYVAVK